MPSTKRNGSLYSRILRHPFAPHAAYGASLAVMGTARFLARGTATTSAAELRRIDVVLCLVRAGFVAGISFLEAPTKFHAPSISKPVALDVGRHVFAALHLTEIVASVARLVYILDWPRVARDVIAALPSALASVLDSASPRSSSLASAFPSWSPPVWPNIAPDLAFLPLQTFVFLPVLLARAADRIEGTVPPKVSTRKSVLYHTAYTVVAGVKVAFLVRHAWHLLVHMSVVPL
ncbi:hypothetical protein H9P43_004936 [Blastocladiella emersonii ATCC 22665]|nr:hypothetical protein H9P43_004936 [Blastocladiella emersonii ATCC 22665]